MRALIGRLAVEASTSIRTSKTSAFNICKETYGCSGKTKVLVAQQMVDIYRMKYPNEPPISGDVLKRISYQ